MLRSVHETSSCYHFYHVITAIKKLTRAKTAACHVTKKPENTFLFIDSDYKA